MKKEKLMRVRIYFKPARAPKWWPRVKGRPQFVGVTCMGFGWLVGDGDEIDARYERAVKNELTVEYGAKTRFEVQDVSRRS